MPRPASALPIPPNELLGIQGSLAPYGSSLWRGDVGNILVARIPSKDPDLVNDIENVAEWASPSDVLEADACVLLTGGNVHTVPMAPLRSHMEQRIAMDRRQAKTLRAQLPPGLSTKVYRAVDDPYRRVRFGVLFPEERMRDVDDDRLDELAVAMGDLLRDGALDDVHCVHLVSATDDVRLATDAFLADMIPRLQDDRRRVQAQQRLLQRQHDDALARGQETAALQNQLSAGVRRGGVRSVDQGPLNWEPESDGPMRDLHAQIDQALGGAKEDEPQAGPMSRLRRHLAAAGYALRVHPSIPQHAVELAADRVGDSPEKILAWSAPVLNRDMAERALAATRDLGAELGLVIAPQADADGQRVLVATRVRWLTPDRIEGLQL